MWLVLHYLFSFCFFYFNISISISNFNTMKSWLLCYAVFITANIQYMLAEFSISLWLVYTSCTCKAAHLFVSLPTFRSKNVTNADDDSRWYHNKCHILWHRQTKSVSASEKTWIIHCLLLKLEITACSWQWIRSTNMQRLLSATRLGAWLWRYMSLACAEWWHLALACVHTWLLAGGIKSALCKFSRYVWVTDLKETPVIIWCHGTYWKRTVSVKPAPWVSWLTLIW